MSKNLWFVRQRRVAGLLPRERHLESSEVNNVDQFYQRLTKDFEDKRTSTYPCTLKKRATTTSAEYTFAIARNSRIPLANGTDH